ncbi:MAG: ATP-binding protein [Terriglobia bacterium]
MTNNVFEREFDLNIEKILEGWETRHAIREIIANALDEQLLTATKEIEIWNDAKGAWHIRDFGRGLKYEHLTENENEEKLKNADRLIGRFGVGLKDSLATLHRRGVGVHIRSKHGDITLREIPKHGFDDVVTLHAVISPPVDGKFVGTEFIFTGVDSSDIQGAKDFFLKFSGEKALDETQYGQILARTSDRVARIYVNGLLVAEEEKFLFSYNITSLTAVMRKALNRERTNVGRTAYSDRVKAMLLASESQTVAEKLTEDLMKIEQGTNRDEVGWTDVAIHSCQILNATKKVVFVTPADLIVARDSVDRAAGDGYKIVTVPESIKDRLRGTKDIEGNVVRELGEYEREWADSFQFEFIPENRLTSQERKVFAQRKRIVEIAGGLSPSVKEIAISRTMRPNLTTRAEALGVWEAENGRIIIKRSELRSLQSFAGTLLHELVHARTGYGDVSRDFETALTTLLGSILTIALDERIERRKHWWNR